MAIFSVRHSTVGRSTHAEGTAGAHVGYITRAGACRLVMGEHMPIPKAGTKGGPARVWLDEQEAGDRKNARVIDKLRLSLPVELDERRRDQLVKRFVDELTNGEVPWLAAIHDKGKDAANPHVHLVLRDRHIEHGKRALGMSEKGSTERVRELWEREANFALGMAGFEERIDRRSLEEQRAEKLALAEEWRDKSPEVAKAYEAEAATLDRKPQASVGPTPRAIEAKGKKSTVMRRVRKEEAGPLSKRIARTFSGDRSPKYTPEDTRRATEARRAAESAYKAQRAAEAEKRAQEAAQRRLEAQRAEEARQAKEAAEAAQRASEEAKRLEKTRDEYAEVTLPLIQRARKDPKFATRITRWGIDLDRPDREAARDDIWRKSGKGYEGRLVWAIVTDDAKAADRKAEEDAQRQRAQHVREFTEGMVRRADTFPTPAGRALWKFPGFKALDPDSIQTSFASKHRSRLSAEEVTTAIRRTLERWVSRITQDLTALKDGKSPTWLTLTGGHHEAAQSLSQALDEHRDLKRPLFDEIAKHWLPEPEQPKPQAPRPKSGWNGPSGP